MSEDKDIQDKLKKITLDTEKDDTPVQKVVPIDQPPPPPKNKLGRKPDWPELEEKDFKKGSYKIRKTTHDKMRRALVTTHLDEKSINTFLDAAINYYVDNTGNDI